LRKSGEAKYFHLNDDLHVLIEVFAPPAEAYARMGHALEEIKKFLIPVSIYFCISFLDFDQSNKMVQNNQFVRYFILMFIKVIILVS